MQYVSNLLGAGNTASPAPEDVLKTLLGMMGSNDAKANHMPHVEPGKGTFFIKQLDMREPEGTAFTARILELYDEAKPRGKVWKQNDLATHKIRVRKLLANAMRTCFYRAVHSVLYFSGSASRHYRNEPSWMQHGALGKAVKVLAKAGLVTATAGKAMPYYSKHRSTASSYAATQKLIDIALECGVSVDSIETKYEREWLVQLYAPKPKPVYDFNKGGLVHARKGEPISFIPSKQEQEWIDTLEAINAFYGQKDVALSLSPVEEQHWLKRENSNSERSGAKYLRPERFQTDIYRVFNNADPANPTFDKGGRLYGGWWMQESEEDRKAITIGRQKTLEIDYAECHARMLYHLEGIDNKDPLYTLPEVTAYEQEMALEADTFRPCIKWLWQVMINGKGRPDQADMPDGIIIPPAFTINQLVGFIEAKHQPIAHRFKTGAGLDLMRIESDIALDVISTAVQEGWVVLSIHDSFISTVDRQERLKELMIQSYVKRLGFEPMFKDK